MPLVSVPDVFCQIQQIPDGGEREARILRMCLEKLITRFTKGSQVVDESQLRGCLATLREVMEQDDEFPRPLLATFDAFAASVLDPDVVTILLSPATVSAA